MTSMTVPEQIKLTENLTEMLLESMLQEAYVISVSHSDYARSIGGVENRLMDEQKSYNENGVDYLHLYPLVPTGRLVDESEPLQIGVSCNGTGIGVTDREGILEALRRLETKHAQSIIVHHLMGFDIALIDRLLDEIGGKKGRFWLHDSFSICPCYVLLRNDLFPCGAPESNSNACTICKYGDMRKVQQRALGRLFERNHLEVVAPSEFMLEFWNEKSGLKATSGRVLPHMRLDWDGTMPARRPDAPLRIGFLGSPLYFKGWDTWVRLEEKFRLDPRYLFFCFASRNSASGGMKWVDVSVTSGDRLAMANALKNYQMDVAFLWSLCPETFSFTLHESLAAGCYVLTYRASGNIQAYLRQNSNRGLVLEDEEALFDLFAGQDLSLLAANYQKNGRPQAEIALLSNVG